MIELGQIGRDKTTGAEGKLVGRAQSLGKDSDQYGISIEGTIIWVDEDKIELLINTPPAPVPVPKKIVGVSYKLHGYVEVEVDEVTPERIEYRLHNVSTQDLLDGIEGMPDIDGDAIEMVEFFPPRVEIVIG